MDRREYSEDELKAIYSGLDAETLKAMRQALDEVEEDRQRARSNAELLKNAIVAENKKERLVKRSLLLMNPPDGLTKEDIENMLSNLSAHDHLKQLRLMEGKKEIYIYDTTLWTENFAQIQFMLEEKDLLKTIAFVVRRDSKIYPRVVTMALLSRPPYGYNEDEVLGALARMKDDLEYSDIGKVVASNGNFGLYSSVHMSERYAQALCEHQEVEWIYDM